MKVALAASLALTATMHTSARAPQAASVAGARPFLVGERAEYGVKFGVIRAGSGSLDVLAIDTVRGRDAYKFAFVLQAGVNLLLFKYQLRDTLTSWVDTARFHTLRHTKQTREQGKLDARQVEIFPERATYTENGKPEVPSVVDALDEISFLFFARTLDLKVGDTLVFPRYYKPDRNPVKLVVLRKERNVKVAAGTYNTVVVQPIFKARGIFSEGGRAEVWIAEDSTRAIVQLKTHLNYGELTLQLRAYRPAMRPAVVPR